MIIVAVALGGLIAGSTLLSVNLFPAITNDSVTYLAYSNDLGGFGFVHAGYRHFGYPVFLWFTEQISTGALSIEPLLFVSFIQRLLLVVGLAYAVRLWRWWSLPVVLFALTAEVLSYTNLVLTEGVSVPLALILVCATGHFISAAKDPLSTRRSARMVGALVVLIALSLVSIRFPFAVFGICPLVMAIAAWGSVHRRDAMILFGVYLVSGAVIVGLISAENQVEYGELTPSSNSARLEYWAAWRITFRLNPSNTLDPDLAEFYGNGDPFDFISQVDSLDIPYSEQAAIYEQAIEEMIVASGSGIWSSRFQSFIGALQGGRLNDLKVIIEKIEASTRMNVDDVIHSNTFAGKNGPEAFAAKLNKGQLPEAVITAPLAEQFPLPSAYVLIQVLLPISLLVCCVALVSRDARLLAVAGLAAVIAYSALIGYIRADNFRVLLTTSCFGIGAAAGALAMWNGQRALGPPIVTSSHQTGIPR